MGIIIFILVVLLLYAIAKASRPIIPLSNHHHLLDTVSFSTQEFYRMVEDLIRDKEIKGADLSRITYSERGVLSARREYLRVKYQNYVFDICAAPFAKKFFVSWWFSEFAEPIYNLLRQIPFLGVFIGKRQKTFFEMDTENMVKDSVVQCVNMAISQMEEAKGIRNPSLLN